MYLDRRLCEHHFRKSNIQFFQAFVIAYTSDFIPRGVYQYYLMKNGLVGYIDSSLSGE